MLSGDIALKTENQIEREFEKEKYTSVGAKTRWVSGTEGMEKTTGTTLEGLGLEALPGLPVLKGQWRSGVQGLRYGGE